jgi:hypothetical protein
MGERSEEAESRRKHAEGAGIPGDVREGCGSWRFPRRERRLRRRVHERMTSRAAFTAFTCPATGAMLAGVKEELIDDAWTAKTQASVETTLEQVLDALRGMADREAAPLVTRAWRCKEAVAAWRAGGEMGRGDLDALLDDVAALYGEVIAVVRRSTWSRDLRRA